MSYLGNQLTSSAFVADVFSGTGAQLAFTGLTFAPAATASIAVFVGGSYQSPISYSVSGTTLTFNSAPAAGTNNIQVLHLGTGATSVVPSDGSVTTVKLSDGAVTGDKIAANIIRANNVVANTLGSNTLTTTGVSAGTFGGADQIPVIIVDTAGRLSYSANVSIETGFNPFLLSGM